MNDDLTRWLNTPTHLSNPLNPVEESCVAALPAEPEPRHLDMLRSTLADGQCYAGVDVTFPPSRPYPGAASTVAILREAAVAMDSVMQRAATHGAVVNPALAPRAHRFLDMVELS